MPRMTLKGVLLLGVPASAVLVIAIAVFLRDDGGQRELRLREKAELEKLGREQSVPRESPDETFGRLKKAFSLGVPPSSEEALRAKKDLQRHGDSAIPLIRRSVYDPSELATLKIELIGLLGEMKEAAAEALLVSILGDRTLEERFRTVALAKLTGRTADPIFQSLRKIYSEEPTFATRHLVLKAIGASQHPESTSILCEAARREPTPSSRIQALDSLGAHVNKPGTLAIVRDVLFQDPEENVKLASLACLGKALDPSAGETLKQVMDDPRSSAAVKKAAASWVERRKVQ